MTIATAFPRLLKSIRPLTLAVSGTAVLAFASSVLADSPPWNAPASAAGKKNPLSGNAGAAAEGKKIFMQTCATCHGNNGRGDGPAAAALNPKPANYTTKAISAESDGSLFWKLSEGRGAMVPFKGVYSENQRWQLITYIRTLQGKK